MLIAISLAIAISSTRELHPDFVSLLTPQQYRHFDGSDDQIFRYRLFVPTITDPCDKKPLIIWLHGLGEAGSDNLLHLRWIDHLILTPPWQRARYPFFVLAVQCPHDNPRWLSYPARDSKIKMIDVMAAILDKTLAELPIDQERIYVSGVCSGGDGCLELAACLPKRLAAIAPLAATYVNPSQIPRLRALPIWMFNSATDPAAPIESSRQIARSLVKFGGNAHHTVVVTSEHDCWTVAYEQYHLLDWLLSQRRGEKGNAPGKIPTTSWISDLAKGWELWQVALQIAILGLPVFVLWTLFKQRPSL